MNSPTSTATLRALACQGGGCRSFFQLGLLETGGDALGPFDELCAVSASTGMVVAHALGIHAEAFAAFARRVRGNPKNFYFGNALVGRPVVPHHRMYRETLLECVTPSRFAALRSGPRVRFLVALGPARSRVATMALAATVLMTRRPQPRLAPHVIEVNALDGPEALADAVLASSAVPPFVPLPTIAGRPAIDGGAVESVPLRLVSPGATVTAILTRPTPWQPLPPSVRVLAPREPLPVAAWDYASMARVQATYDAGRRVGERLQLAR